MTLLKIGRYIINENNITHIDLDAYWEDEEGRPNQGVIIWFTSPHYELNENLNSIVNTPYCLKLWREEDVKAIKFYYMLSKSQIFDIESEYKTYNSVLQS